MNLQALAVFATVAKEGSLTRAAEKLHVSQPAVGFQIKNLQEQTGLQLLKRTAQGMQLTADGATLLPLAEKVLQAQSTFKIAAARLHNEIRGSLRVGTILDPEFTRLGAWLKHVLALSHHLEIALAHSMSGDVMESVIRENLDAGFYLSIPNESSVPESVSITTLTPFIYKVVAPAGWARQVLGRNWAQLAALPWLATPPASAHHRLLAQVYGPDADTGLEMSKVAMVDQEASMLDLVKSGVGLSLVRDHIALREAQAHGLVIADAVELQCTLSFVCLSRRVQEPAIAAALEALEQVWPRFGALNDRS